MSKLIVIVGATGQQGGSILRAYGSDPSWRIRAITRKSSSPKAQALLRISDRIEVVEADLENLSSLQEAFKGANVIFGVTDFWAVYGNTSNRELVDQSQTYPEWCQQVEIRQGKNIFEAAAAVPTLERLVYSSLNHFSKVSGGKYKNVLHFDSKAIAAEWAEEKYPEVWAKTSIVQLGVYLSNFVSTPFFMPRKDGDTYIFSIAGGSTGSWPWVAAEHDTGIIVRALLAAPAGKNIVAYRELLPMREFVQLIGEELGIKVQLERKLHPGVPGELRLELDETFLAAEEFGYWDEADKSIIQPSDLGLTSKELGNVREYIKAQDWSSVLSGTLEDRSFF